MSRIRRRGATLGLIAVLSLVLAILGIAFFFLVKLVGGHRELERATDSGNLNVAKQSLTSPFLRVFGAPPYDISDSFILGEVQKNFSEFRDMSNGQLDLRVFDRCVGYTFLTAVNASADNYPNPPNPLGIARARQLIQVLNDPTNGVGVSLARKLKSDPALDVNFASLADANDIQMLQPL